MIIYTDKVSGGVKVKMLPLIMINPKYKSDKGLIAHEKEHVKQWLIWFAASLALWPLIGFWSVMAGAMAHDLIYTFIRQYRQWSEVQAFKSQLKHGGSLELAAKHLANDYDLKLTIAQARKLLK